MLKFYFNTISLLVLSSFLLNGQQTVGTFYNDSLSYDGYTLVAPASARTAHIVDNCGFEINRWESEYRAGLVGYFTKEGKLLRAGSTGDYFNGGGAGGIVERYSWEGDLEWSFRYSDEQKRQHHDVEELPNGNILILAWELITRDEMINKGRNASQVPQNGMWLEHVVEVRPLLPDSAVIIWEWHLVDHLVQEFNANLDNFGIVLEHPEQFDANYSPGGNSSDWVHFNAMDYNEELDQIILNSRTFCEFFIIDHSTSTEEAATSEGGLRNMGGDFLYRWGNPRTYQRGTVADQLLFGAHDVSWISPGLPDAGKITVYNNGIGRPGQDFSEILMIDPPVNEDGTYDIEDMFAYGPIEVDFQYDGLPDEGFYSNTMSGVSRLPNGNFLITEAGNGHGIEIDSNKNIVWEYINPVGVSGPVSQGSYPPANNVFRFYRYATDYKGFDDKDLTPIGPLELDYIDYGCTLYNDINVAVINLVDGLQNVAVYHDIENSQLQVSNILNKNLQIDVYSISGQPVSSLRKQDAQMALSTNNWSNGCYAVRATDVDSGKQLVFKLMIF